MDWINFAKETRTTTFFRDFAISEIKVAYRIMEYLAPDSHFPPKIDEVTMTLIKNEHLLEALQRILSNDIDCDIDLSHWSQELNKKGLELMEHLYKEWIISKKNAKELKRQELLKQLADIESEEVE